MSSASREGDVESCHMLLMVSEQWFLHVCLQERKVNTLPDWIQYLIWQQGSVWFSSKELQQSVHDCLNFVQYSTWCLDRHSTRIIMRKCTRKLVFSLQKCARSANCMSSAQSAIGADADEAHQVMLGLFQNEMICLSCHQQILKFVAFRPASLPSLYIPMPSNLENDLSSPCTTA